MNDVELPAELLEFMACPNCQSQLALDQDKQELICLGAACGLAFPVTDGIPVMLIDEARKPGK